MVSYNTDLLDRYLAPYISEFTTCDAPDIADAHPEAPHWLANHFLNSVYRSTYKNKFRQYAFNQVLRAQVAFADYQEARKCTAMYLSKGKPDNPAIRLYFKALSRWESCLLNLQIFIDVMNKMKKEVGDAQVFNPGDGTPEQRAYLLGNAVKHFGGDIFDGNHNEADTVPLWLTNTGLATRKAQVTYGELAQLVSEVAKAANELQDAKSFCEGS